MHQASVPLFRQSLAALRAVLDKAEAHCKTGDLDPADLLSARLAPDMFTLTEQVRRATFHACQCAAQLGNVETPTFDDDEADFDDLRGRIDGAIEFVSSFTPARFEGSETRMHKIPTRVAVLEMTGQDFLLHFAIPQFLFHVTTAYDIIRHNGVEIGKRDYLGSADDR
jgi:hypothetical protein